MTRFLTSLVGLFFSVNAFATLDCSKIPMHQSMVAKCIFRTIIEKGIPNNHPAVIELSRQANELIGKGMKNSKEYSTLFLGGERDAFTYIVSVDFYANTEFKSVAAVMTAYPQGNAEIKKVFSQEEIADWLRK